MVSERSTFSLILAALAIGLIGVSFTMDWFTYYQSSGRQTPYGGFHAENETGVVSSSLETSPGAFEGDAQPQDAEKAQQYVDWEAWSLYAAIGLLALIILGEIPGPDRIITRPVSLTLYGIAFAATAFSLIVAWFFFPGTIEPRVDDPFTSFLAEDGYTRTTLWWGWVAAALAVPMIVAGFLVKFQAGAPDPQQVVELMLEEEKST
jgi:hypothetical protein